MKKIKLTKLIVCLFTGIIMTYCSSVSAKSKHITSFSNSVVNYLRIGDDNEFTEKNYNIFTATVSYNEEGYNLIIMTDKARDYDLSLKDSNSGQTIPLEKKYDSMSGVRWWQNSDLLKLKAGAHKLNLIVTSDNVVIEADELDIKITSGKNISLDDLINSIAVVNDNNHLCSFYATDKEVTSPDQLCLMAPYPNIVSSNVELQAVSKNEELLMSFGDSPDYEKSPVTTVHVDGMANEQKVTVLNVKDTATGDIVARIPVILKLNKPVNKIKVNNSILLPINNEVEYDIKLDQPLKNYNVQIEAMVPMSGYKIYFDTGEQNIEGADVISMAATVSDSKDSPLDFRKVFYVYDENSGAQIPYTVHVKHVWEKPDSSSNSKSSENINL